MSTDEFWKDWSNSQVATKWGGEMWVTVEELYQAFKARLAAEECGGHTPDEGSAP